MSGVGSCASVWGDEGDDGVYAVSCEEFADVDDSFVVGVSVFFAEAEAFAEVSSYFVAVEEFYF